MKQLLQRLAFALWCMGLSGVAQAQGPALDPSFAITSAVGTLTPASPYLNGMVRQPDGKIIVAGDLAVFNGVPVNRVVRLLPNGQVDATYQVAPIDGFVLDLALQPDGNLLLGGRFTNVGGQPRFGLARLLSNGTLDAGFAPPLGRTPTYASAVEKIVLQPGVGIIVSGDLALPAGTAASRLVRLTETTGALDPAFPTFPLFIDVFDVLPQPNGNLVFASNPRRLGSQVCNVWGTLPDGTPDPAFVPLPGTVDANGLVRDPRTGNIYVAAAVRGTGLDREPVRLLPNGILDPTFNAAGAFVAGTSTPSGRRGLVRSLAVQPNGRLLLGGEFALGGGSYAGSWRLLPNGTRDPSYQPGNGPDAGVNKAMVQPDGALLFGGTFSRAGGSVLNCLARMLDPNVLSINNNQVAADLIAWPMPAHDVLHIHLTAARQARQLVLLDALGRVVRCQAIPAGQEAPTLPTVGLPPGAYLLRVSFANGPFTYQRVTVE